MVKRQNKNNAKVIINQGESGCAAKASKIGASTLYEYCTFKAFVYIIQDNWSF